MTIFIDQPAEREIVQTVCEIRGWCTVPRFGSGRLRFEIDGDPILFTPMRRPDVEAVYPEDRVYGFVIHFDLAYHMRAIRDSALYLDVLGGDAEQAKVRFQVYPSALRTCMAAASGS
jgi:hypothetical protein